MAFEQTRFMGASIVSFQASVGWNEQTSTLTVNVVEDTRSGDEFSPPLIGSPVYFEFGDFRFGGLFQTYSEENSTSGMPVYNITLIDPREILDGSQLILDGYNGSTLGVPNLFNVYGYRENLSFGGANVNESGMPWLLIASAVNGMINTISVATGFGGPYLEFRGYNYLIDITELPITPSYYRIGGGSVSMIEAISQVCQDAGFDYHVVLEFIDGYHVIKFKTVSRKAQPPLGQIDSFIGGTDGVISNSKGLELRNEIATAFVVGGQVAQLYQQDNTEYGDGFEASNTIWPFWGIDANGNAIIGTGDFRDNSHTFTLDSRMVNVLGVGASYTASVGELRAAIASADDWRSYIEIMEPEKAQQIGITGPWQTDETPLQLALQGLEFPPGYFVNTSKKRAQNSGNNTDDNFSEENIDKLYEFVKKYADEYYGRKFMVRIPFVTASEEPETFTITLSQEPTEGGWLEEDSEPLGLPVQYEDLFTTQDGRFQAFIRVGSANSYDLSNMNPDDAVVVDNVLFLKVQLEPYLTYLNKDDFESPRAIMTLPTPLNARPQEDDVCTWFAGLELALQARKGSALTSAERRILNKSMSNVSGGKAFFGLSPVAYAPEFAAIPLKSNILTYGPWYNLGPTGKVRFERDDSLVPWNYGGFDVMNLAGGAKVNDAITRMQVGEMGSVSVPGTPNIQLGDALQYGGPNVTNINVQFGKDGVTTTYQMRTYTPKWGGFAKQNADRFTRLARSAQEFRRSVRQLFRAPPPPGATFYANRERAYIGKSGSKMFQARTPHDIMIGSVIPDSGDAKQTMVSALTFHEAVVGLNAHSGEKFNNTAMMSMEGLYRPYSVNPAHTGIGHFEEPTATATYPTVNDLNPFGSGEHRMTDIMFATCDDSGGGYPNNGANSLSTKNPLWDLTTARGVALKGPLIISGFGYDTNGKPVPNADSGNPGNNFAEGYRNQPHTWKTGPLDLRWENNRKLWVTGSTPELAIIVMQSGLFDSGGRPCYLARSLLGINGTTKVFTYSDAAPNIASGDFTLFNMQESAGANHTLAVGSPVMVYSAYGERFCNERVRTLISNDVRYYV